MEEQKPTIDLTHHTFELFGQHFNQETILWSFVVYAFLIGLALILRRGLTSGVPGGLQNLVESVFEFLYGLINDSIHDKSRKAVPPLIITFFLYLLISNWMGVIPGVHSPTSDSSTTFALALIVFVLIHYYGVSAKGLGGYLMHYQPKNPFMLLINLIDEIAKPFTLALRLFGNMFAKKVVIMMIAVLLGTNLFAIPMVLTNLIWIPFSLFMGAIQAFIFTVLAVVYWSFALDKGH